MSTLGKYLDNLVCDFQSLGLHATISSLHIAPQGSEPITVDQAAIQLLEIKIPVEVPRERKRIEQSLAEQVREWTMDSLRLMLPMEMITGPTLARLTRAIHQGSRQVQLMLSKEEPVLHRVLLDYAQCVVAEIWEDCKQLFHQGLGMTRESLEDGYSCFEKASSTLMDWLRVRHDFSRGGMQQDPQADETARSTTATEVGIAHVRLTLTA